MSSDQDDILLAKLQRTIDSWSTEVTDAHQKLTSQIGDAREQLDTLLDVLGTNRDGQPEKPAQAQPQYKQWTPPTQSVEMAPKKKPEASPTDESPVEAPLDAENTRSELARLIQTNEELSQEIANRKYEDRAAASALEVARNELQEIDRAAPPNEEMREQLQRKTTELETARLEIVSLSNALRAFKSDLAEDVATQEVRNLEIVGDLQAADTRIQDQHTQIQDLKRALDEGRAASEQFVKAITDLESERDALHSECQRLIHQDDALQVEIQSVRQDLEKSKRIETQLQSDTRTLRQSLDEARQIEIELTEELASIKMEYGRQSEALTESVQELEAHWKLAEQAVENDARLTQRIDGLESQLNHATKELDQTQHQLQSKEQLLEREQQAHALELENLQVQKQEEIYNVLKTLEERGLAPEEAEATLALTKKQQRIADLENQNERLSAMLKTLETQVHALEAAPQRTPSSNSADLDQLRAELVAFEELLVQREHAVEAAAAKMKTLEETALAVQAQVAALSQERRAQKASPEHEEAQREIEELKASLTEAGTRQEAQAMRMQETEDELTEYRLRLDTAIAERNDALSDSSDVPHILNEALAETDALKERLAEREAELEALKRDQDAEQQPFAMDFPAYDNAGKKRSMGTILVESKIITGKQLESALEEQRTAKKRRLGSILVEKGLIREEIVSQVIASQLKLPFVRLSDQQIQRGALALMDGRLATHHMSFPIRATSDEITVAMANPLDLIAIEDLEFATSVKVNPVVATLSDIASMIVQHYGVAIGEAIVEDNFQNQSPPPLPKKATEPATDK